MEKTSDDEASFTSWWSDSHRRPHQSQWLQTTLTELDNKIKMILDIIEEDGDTFSERAEMYYKKRPQLIEMVQDLQKSYCSLADKYAHLRSEFARVTSLESSSISSRLIQHLQNCNIGNPENTLAEPDMSIHPIQEFKNAIEIFGNCKNGSGQQKVDCGTSEDFVVVDFKVETLEKEKKWNELRQMVSTLMEENVQQQDKLIKRNDEKREVIKKVNVQIHRLMNENIVLKSYLAQHKKSQISRLKEAILNKFSR